MIAIWKRVKYLKILLTNELDLDFVTDIPCAKFCNNPNFTLLPALMLSLPMSQSSRYTSRNMLVQLRYTE